MVFVLHLDLSSLCVGSLVQLVLGGFMHLRHKNLVPTPFLTLSFGFVFTTLQFGLCK